jgi:DNA-binding MarR family transcriptional regulator
MQRGQKSLRDREEQRLNPSYSDLIQQLSQAESQITRRLAAVLAAHGDMTVDEWRVLDLLSDGQGRPMRDVSEFALLPAANTTRLIDRMTAANLVHRRTDPDDRRRILVFLAPRGRKRMETLAPLVEQSYAELSPSVADELAKTLTQVCALLTDPAA